jgi:hypothetical protein
MLADELHQKSDVCVDDNTDARINDEAVASVVIAVAAAEHSSADT